MKREDIKEMFECIMTLGLEGDEAIDYIDKMIKECDGWISVEEILPKESGRYWCYIEYQSDLGKQFYQWNCSFNNGLFNTDENFHTVTHWMPLPSPPAK